MTGYITHINKNAGYGFVRGEEKSYFFRASDVEDYNFDDLQKGDELTFVPEENDRAPIAKKCLILSYK